MAQNIRRPYAKIVTSRGDYQLTPEDVLWAARSAFFEGGNPEDVLWTETQRFVLYRPSFDTFTKFVRAFSQPINPKWARGGEFCGDNGSYVGTDYCAEDRLARRDLAETITWAQMQAEDPKLTAAVTRWANGRQKNTLPRATNFADVKVSAQWLANHDGDVLKEDGNVYIVEAAARPWGRNHVQMKGHDGALANATGVHVGTPGAQVATVLFNAFLHPLKVRV